MHLSSLLVVFTLVAFVNVLLIEYVGGGIPLLLRQNYSEEQDGLKVNSRKLLNNEEALEVLSRNRHKPPLFSAAANIFMVFFLSLAMMSLVLFLFFVIYLKYRQNRMSEQEEGERINLSPMEGTKQTINEEYLEGIFRDQFSSLNKFPTISPSQCETHSWTEIPITREKEENQEESNISKKDDVLTNHIPGKTECNQSKNNNHVSLRDDLPKSIEKLDQSKSSKQNIQSEDDRIEIVEESKCVDTVNPDDAEIGVCEVKESLPDKSQEIQSSPCCSKSKSDPNTHEACSRLSDIEFFSADEYFEAQNENEGEQNANLEETTETTFKAWDKMRHALNMKMRLKPKEEEEVIKKPRRGRKAKAKAKATPARRSGRTR